MTGTDDLPGDTNGQVLRRMREHGDDLTTQRPVDFEHVLPNAKAAEAMAAQARALGYEVVIARRGMLSRSRDVRCTRTMVPTHTGITEVEERLGTIARGLGGYEDGWGCFLPD